MTNAELLPDKINMVNESGDVVVRDDLSPETDDVEGFEDPIEADRSLNFYTVEDMILSGIEESRAGGYATLKVRTGERLKPLGQFLAIDAYKYGLTNEEIRELLKKYVPVTDAGARTIGRIASGGVGQRRSFDARELASGLHKEFDD